MGNYWTVDPDAGALSFGVGALFAEAGALFVVAGAAGLVVAADAGAAALDADALLPCSLLDFLEQEASVTAPNNTNGKIKIIFTGGLLKMMTARLS